MADKPTPKHQKMYKGSPRIEADESGKKVVKKGPTEAEKKASEVASGTDGEAGNHEAVMSMTQKHAKEMLELSHKHAQEYVQMAQKSALNGTPENKGEGE